MDLYGKLQLGWAFGFGGSQLHFIDNNTLVYGCGNILTFVDCSGSHVRSLPSEGRGIGPIAVCPRLGVQMIAYAEATLQPQIFVLKYPECSLVATLKGQAQLEYTSLAFSTDGRRLASLSGVPDFLLTVWDCQDGTEVCTTVVGSGGRELSFNPLNWRQLCLVGPARTTFWSLEQCGPQSLLSPLEMDLPDRSTPVGTLVQPKHPPLTIPTKNSSTDHIGKKLERMETKSDHPLSLFTPPGMLTVLYKESYDEFACKKDPVVLTSHCWTPHQSIYLGCTGGQLLLADFETGAVKVLTNPQVIQVKDHSLYSLASQSSGVNEGGAADKTKDHGDQKGTGGGKKEEEEEEEEEKPPQTAHAVLGEGSINCLALSRKGLFTAGKNGTICCFEQTTELKLMDRHSLEQPVTCLAWSTHYGRLAIGTERGSIYLSDPLKLSSVSLLSDHRHSRLTGIDVLTPGSQHCTTCRQDGTIQIWDIEGAAQVGSFNLKTECFCLACPISCPMAVVGTGSGHLCMLSLTDPSTPRLVAKRHMYHSPVRAIRCDQHGRFMCTISSEGPAFFYDARPSTEFAVLGHIAIRGEALELSILSLGEGPEAKTQAAVLAMTDGKSMVTLIQLPNFIVDQAPPELYANATKRLSAKFILQQEAQITEPISGFTLALNNTAFALLQSSLQLAKFTLPPADEKESVDWELSPDSCFTAHELDSGQTVLSFHQKWLASAAPGGKLLLRLVENPERTVTCTPHHYNSGGSSGVVFTNDSQCVLSTGDGGTLTCWKWEFSSHGSVKGSAAAEYAQRCMRKLGGLHSRESTALEAMPEVEEGEVKTWLEAAQDEAHRTEDEKYAERKAQLRREIDELRGKVLSMIASNDQLPDIEKLERQEFILDTEEHQRLQVEEDALIQQVREEIELSNLAKQFLREQIKRECWGAMVVKGKVVKAFQMHLEVSNYAMRACSEAMLQELERVKTLRKVTVEERRVRGEAAAGLKLTLQSIKTEEPLLDDEELGDQQREGEEEGDPDALLGSHGAQYGGASELLYSQFELHSPVTKRHQIVLLQDCVHRIKEAFNKEFDEVFRLKEAEIARIQEKNVRIRKITGQLKLEEPLVQPSLDDNEQPERLLTVEDEEVTVEKYVSREERKKMEEAAIVEEQRKLTEGDNARERALDMMMGGRLEANIEEDLFKDFPRPEFMQKEAGEMSEEEIRMARDFERKEADFLEEREKLKKSLEAELRKLQGSITQAMEQFDERLHKLFHLKIRTEMAIHQEELKILRLAQVLLMEEEVVLREKQLHKFLKEKKTAKVQLGSTLGAAKRQVEEFREQYEQLAAEDRELDKSFKRDFADCEPYTDQLYKLFRKRPRGQRLKPGPSEGGLIPDPKSQNPFPQRPPSAAGGHGVRVGGEDPMVELDHPSHMPEGLEPAANWERLVAARRRKVESEQKVKGMALKLAEMMAFLQKRQAEDEHVQQEIQDAFKELNKLQEDKTLFDLNLEIQFLLKQGQVEVDTGEFIPDFSDSVLVHRSAIEELNRQIKMLGEAKLASMTQCGELKRGIHMLEWEHQKLRMEAEDLVEKARDIQLLRVTKELQQRLMEEQLANKDQHEIDTLEKTIDLLQQKHQKNVREKQRALERLQQQVEERRTENKSLDHQLMELQVSVLERQAVDNLAGVPPSEANAEQRMHDIVTRRRLVETAKAQAQEISVLQTEVERLRMRTFPALVQVD